MVESNIPINLGLNLNFNGFEKRNAHLIKSSVQRNMGAGASAWHDAFALKLSQEQKTRYKTYHAELSQKGLNEKAIREELEKRLNTEISTKQKPPQNGSVSIKASAVSSKKTTLNRGSFDRAGEETPRTIGRDYSRGSFDKGETQKSSIREVRGSFDKKLPPTSASTSTRTKEKEAVPNSTSTRTKETEAQPSSSTLVSTRTKEKETPLPPTLRSARSDSNKSLQSSQRRPSKSDSAENSDESPTRQVESLVVVEPAWVSTDETKPFGCELCKTAFKTAAQLEQHVKFSYLHAKSLADSQVEVKKLHRAENIARMVHFCLEAMKKKSKHVDDESLSVPARRWLWAIRKVMQQNAIARTAHLLLEQGVHTAGRKKLEKSALVYTGSKFFWRHKETLEFHMFLHKSDDEVTVKKAPILEIIAFDPVKHKEYPRIYVRYAAVMKLLTDEIVAATPLPVEAQPELLPIQSSSSVRRGSKTGKEPAVAVSTKQKEDKSTPQYEICDIVIAEYLISKLELVNIPGKLGSHRLSIVTEDGILRSSSGTNQVNLSELMVEPHVVETDVKRALVTRRRRSTQADVINTVADLETHREQFQLLARKAASHVGISSPTKAANPNNPTPLPPLPVNGKIASFDQNDARLNSVEAGIGFASENSFENLPPPVESPTKSSKNMSMKFKQLSIDAEEEGGDSLNNIPVDLYTLRNEATDASIDLEEGFLPLPDEDAPAYPMM